MSFFCSNPTFVQLVRGKKMGPRRKRGFVEKTVENATSDVTSKMPCIDSEEENLHQVDKSCTVSISIEFWYGF